jgi:formylmethanofuran dehydrogenase subunit E
LKLEGPVTTHAAVSALDAAPGLQQALAATVARHGRLCPRQVLGVRIGLAGIGALGVDPDAAGRPLLVIVETPGCFASGVEEATGCSVGHRNLDVADYGKVAATFIDTRNGAGVRIVPRAGVRTRAVWYAPERSGLYEQQLHGYQRIPDADLLSIVPVEFAGDLEAHLGQPGVRLACDVCSEEILNRREVVRHGSTLCRPCAFGAYYRTVAHGQARTAS